MAKRGVALGGAMAVVLLAPMAATGEELGPTPVHLTWLDVTGVTVGVDGVARGECRSMLKEAGLEVIWRRGSGGEEARPGEIRIILVDRLVVDAAARRSVMGATPARRRAHPVVWIHVGSIRATLGYPPDFPILDLPLRARRDLGVALGRVVAHEVVHVLVPSLRHGQGLMSPIHTPSGLTGSRPPVEPRVAEEIRAAFESHPGAARPDGDLLAASGSPALHD